MAIWQYNFTIVPRNILNCLKKYVDKDGWLDDESCWLENPIKADFFKEIEQILPKRKSWNTDIILYGNQESNRFEVYKNESDTVISVSFRIDYTSEYEDILRSLLAFIEMNGLVILDEKLEFLDNNFIAIKSHIEKSEQQDVYERLKNK